MPENFMILKPSRISKWQLKYFEGVSKKMGISVSGLRRLSYSVFILNGHNYRNLNKEMADEIHFEARKRAAI
jgi:hypothetical protein